MNKYKKEVMKMGLFESTLKSIKPADQDAMNKAWDKINNLSKPIGSLGELEKIAAKMAGITGKVENKICKKNTIVMCADNGVIEEGVSACPPHLTEILTVNLTRGCTGVTCMSEHIGAEVTTVDIGVDGIIHNEKVINKKIAMGTKNIAKGPAMTREEAIKAIEAGIEIADKLYEEGYDILGTGEMGAGNTTTSAAVLSVLLNLSPDVTCGWGTGISEEKFENKKRVITNAIKVNNPDKNDPIDVLSKLGGFDIAGLCGCFLSAAKNRIPIVIDGVISCAAALLATRISSLVKDYLFTSHLSAEPAAKLALEEMGLTPILNLNMRLGEGSGCPMAFSIIDMALYVANNMASFESADIDKEQIK